MNAAAQLQMFEPEASKLAELVTTYTRNAQFEEKKAELLQFAGYTSAALMSARAANEAYDLAATCEMALQFERLAGLA